jgi:Fe-S-cluster-containing dehydrogenase component/DMSO reductase anchor subunit
MMRKGFIFDSGKCVACSSCSVACAIENGSEKRLRSIFTNNPEAIEKVQVLNISLACNHCERSLCLEGCPASAYYRDEVTGAVIIDENKCIGCNYCTWNCPYDAPKYSEKKGVIEKCNLCISLIKSDFLPACVNGCPTGALGFGDIPNKIDLVENSPLPEKNINPAILVEDISELNNVRIVPETQSHTTIKTNDYFNSFGNLFGNVSLFLFSFLTTLSVSYVITSLYKGVFPSKIISILLLISIVFTSLIHLGKKIRAWRSVSNILHSPLSREIVMFVIYSLLTIAFAVFEIPMLFVATSVSGIALLIFIDTVYQFSESDRKFFFHTGQTFFSALLIISFLCKGVLPVLVLGFLKMLLTIFQIRAKPKNNIIFSLRFVRLTLLFVAVLGLVSTRVSEMNPLIVIFLAGELLDRLIFYIDFDPISIKSILRHYK